MFESITQLFLPQFAKVLAFLIIFISGYTVINLTGGIPTSGGKIVPKTKSLIIICIGGAFLLLVVEPILETIVLALLNQFVEYALPTILILGGIALLKFDEKMRWDYSKYGIGCILLGFLWIVLI